VLHAVAGEYRQLSVIPLYGQRDGVLSFQGEEELLERLKSDFGAEEIFDEDNDDPETED